jgi:hypothetical protein
MRMGSSLLGEATVRDGVARLERDKEAPRRSAGCVLPDEMNPGSLMTSRDAGAAGVVGTIVAMPEIGVAPE